MADCVNISYSGYMDYFVIYRNAEMDIIDYVCDVLGVDAYEVREHRHYKKLTSCKRIITDILLKRRYSTTQAGEVLGLDHSTVLHHQRNMTAKERFMATQINNSLPETVNLKRIPERKKVVKVEPKKLIRHYDYKKGCVVEEYI